MIRIKEDIPVEDLTQDELGRANLVGLIANAIKEKISRPHPALTIGIYGAWGEGKTSLMKMVKAELSRCAIKSEWYNPWCIGNEGSILPGFFAMLSSVAYEDDDIAKTIELYSRGFLAAIDSSTLNPDAALYLARMTQCLPASGNDIKALKSSISKALVEKEKHPIVFIDDADRLSSTEIRVLLKTIRQIADFDNTIYVIGVDPAAVADVLDSTYGNNVTGDGYSRGRYYLEKIIQVPIVLPSIQEAIIQKQINKTLREIAEEFRIILDEDALHDITKTVSPAFSTMRGIVRYGNQIRFVLPSIYNEVDYVDLCLMEVLKYLNEQGWLEIKRQRENLLGEIPFTRGDKEREKALKDALQSGVSVVLAHFPKEKQSFVETLLLRHLFVKRYGHGSLSKKINNKLYFDQYFIGGVPEGIIPRSEAEQYAFLVNTNLDGAIAWVNSKLSTYSISEVERVSRLVMEMSSRENSSDIAGKLCKVLSFSDMVQKYTKSLYCNHTDIDKTITGWIIPRYMVVYVDGETKPDTKKEAEVLKEIFSKAPLNYCVCLLYGVYSDSCEPPEDEKDVFDLLKTRMLELGDLAIFEYSSLVGRLFLRLWKKLDPKEYDSYLGRVLMNESFSAGSFVVKCLSAVGDGDYINVIADITSLFRDKWELFKAGLAKYEDKGNRLFKEFYHFRVLG